MKLHRVERKTKGNAPASSAESGLTTMGTSHRSTSPVLSGPSCDRRRLGWITTIVVLLAAGALTAADAWRPSGSAAPPRPLPRDAEHALELEDWPALLGSLADTPLTNTILRLVVVRALFETGRLPEEQFSWFHRPGPDLLSTSDLQAYAGAAHLAEALLQLGYLNGAERLAFDSLEMEGEGPSALRTLARLHVVKGLTNAASVFLNRLQAYSEHRAWADRIRAGLVTNAPATEDPTISRIRANLVTRDRIVAGLTTDRLLKQVLEANPENDMAYQFLMAHQLLGRDLLRARQTLAKSAPDHEAPLPRHYAEAVLLHQQLYPRISLGALPSRVPPVVAASFEGFRKMMNQAKGSAKRAQADAWRNFGDSYWYYHFFGPIHQSTSPPNPGGL